MQKRIFFRLWDEWSLPLHNPKLIQQDWIFTDIVPFSSFFGWLDQLKKYYFCYKLFHFFRATDLDDLIADLFHFTIGSKNIWVDKVLYLEV